MKNLITYLKALWRRGLDSQRKEVGVILEEATIEHPFSTYSAPFGTCWQPSGKLHSVVRYAAMLVMLFTIGSGNVWGVDYTYSFTINADDFNTTSYVANNNEKTSTATCTTDGSKTMSVKWTSYQVMKNSSNMQWQKSKGYIYNSTDLGTINSVTVTSSAGSFTTYYGTSEQPSSGSAGSGKGYFKTSVGGATGTTSQIVINFTISEGGGSTPSLTPTPTSLDWGSVLQSSSQSTKTFDISGSNLTGNLSVAVTGGYSVSCGSSITVTSGTPNVTTITVTPPSTSTTGTKNGTVTISGGGLASNVVVNLSMTVNAASTVTWMVNGSEYTTTLVANGSKPEFPDNPSSCDGTSTTFVGWTPTPWSGKLDDVSAKTIYTSGAAMPNVGGAVTYHAVFAAQSDFTRVNNTSELATGKLLVIVDAYNSKTLNTDLSASTAPTETSGKITPSANMIWTLEANSTNWKLKTGSNYLKGDANPTSSSKTKTISLGTSGNLTWVIASNSYTNNGTPVFSIRNSSSGNAGLEYSSGWKLYYTTNLNTSYYTEKLYISSYSKYLTTCCTDPGLNYGTGSVTKTFGNGTFKNTLTNSHSVSVTYESSNTDVATVASDGTVTIKGAGNATITARFAGNSTYCADEASYTLTVNKASISPTLTYTPNSVAAGSNTSAPTVGANPGGGGVTYAITSATPPGCATINTSTGVVTGVAVGSVTVTATVAATDNYNGNTATATVSIIAASYFQNGATVFIQADSKDYSAWKDDACVKAWFNASGAGGAAQTTYWLFDATDTDAGKKLFAAVVPASGNLNQVTVQRFAEGCGSFWNDNGTLTQASSGGVNTLHSYGSADNNIAWNGSSTTLSLYGSQNSWGSSLATFADQGSGVWTASFSNYAPDATSKDYKIKTSYNNGWIGNTGSNNNATLSGMIVGSTYNVTATLNVTTHALTMSKTFVKGTVHFDLQGHGSAISDLENVTAGSKISAPSPAPSATGWDFGGWFKEPACTNAWDFANDVVNETMTLYAKWNKHTYTITSTLNNCSSSPAIPSSYEYTGSAASLSYTITPSSGYRLPTEITVSGTTYTWNSTTGALVLTGIITSNVTITITAVQTHTVDWYVGGSAPANKIDDDGQTTVVDHGGKISDFPATTPDGSACDKEFVGWTNTSSYVHGTSPLFNDVAGSPTINANASFYAVFAEGGNTEYVLTPAASLTAGEYVIAAYDDANSKYLALTGAVSAASLGSNSDMVNETTGFTISEGKFTTLPTGACEFVLTAYTGETDNGFYIQNPADDKYLDYQTTTNRRLWFYAATDYEDGGVPTTPWAAWYGVALSKDGFPDNGMYLKYVDETYSLMSNGSGTTFVRGYANDNTKYKPIYLFKKTGGATGHTINCADCGTSVTPTYTAAPTGGTVSVTKSASPVASGSTVKTCSSVDLSVTITPASHYTLTGFTATGLTTGTATISPAVNTVVPTTSAQTFTVTVSAAATGTLNLTPVLTEDAHKVISWVVHGSSASIADGHGTTWVYSGEDLTAIPAEPGAPTGCDDKVFVGWSENDGGATEEDASYYDDLFTTLVGAPTGITTDKTFTAVFATPAAGLGGTVMWDEPWTGYDNGDQPASKSGYNSATISYAYGESGTKVYAGADQHYAGGTQPELMVVKSGGTFTASNIPTAGQTSLTLTYKTNYSANVTVTSGTSGVTVSDPDVSGTTCTRTITISQSPATNNFALTFTMTKSDKNARLDDINIAVPGSSSMSGYVTTCEDTWTITYYKNTEDAVTNLPSPTGISKSTGSGTLSSKVPVRYGYTFDGWATSAGGSVAYAAGAAVSSVSADMDLYAKWSVTPVTEINLSKTSLDKYVGDPSVTLSVLSVLPDGANTSVTWSSSNSSIATVNSSTGEVNFVAEGTANIIATSSITSGTTATCVVTVWAKPSVSFLDNLHSLTEDKDGNALSGYNLTDVAGTPVVFPILANQSAGSGTCEDEHYVFVGWTTSDNNTDPEDHLVTSHNLTNGDNITYYAVWADGVAGTTYTKLTSSTFKTSPAKYVIGAEYNGTTRYFYSCEKTDKNNSWGYVTADLASNTPIEFTLSGTAAALVATSTEVSARYLKPLATKDFQLSASSQTVELKSDGTIYNNNVDETDWRLLYNMAGGLRWYSSTVSGSASAYFYEVVAGGEVNYRTSCCADKVSAPIVTATKTSTTVTLTWAAVSGATGYELQWNGGAWTAATSGVVKSDLTPNTNYSWRVRATYVPPKCGADIASGSTTTNQVYYVTYAGGSGTGTCNATGSTTDATAYEAGATVTLQSNGFTLVGHTFNEWTEDDEDITISSNQFTMPEHDVVITATWTPKVDKFYDRMHDGTDASHGGIADGDGKYYITREGCSYTVPSLTDNTSGATACHTKHYVLMGWTAESHLNSDGTLKTGHEGYVYTGGGTQTATGATYYAVWAEVEE